ncbi:MAG: tRNA (adenosine(37)-N6)-threonylcarbamoyltransferase complex dimerization subunit type 1 TsaB [Bdellovibrionales bacterium]|nr:tRNA (adenosine(37)-N6)-threonylcarbamoyltransferase complex dimerization subunit type 1 TsaB [Bdellovibrionales bacterium]
MKCLCIDTSTSATILGLCDGHELLAEITLPSADHSAMLLDSIKTLLEFSRLELSAIDGYGIVTGPGSFTGLRIGLATIKGFHLTLKKPAVSINSLEALARNIPQYSGIIAPVIHSRKGRVFSAIYKWNQENLISLKSPTEIDPESLLSENPEALVVGSALIRQPELFKTAKAAPLSLAHTRGSVLCQMALSKFERSDLLDLSVAEPDYVVTNVASRV